MRLAILLGVLVAVMAMFFVGPKLGGSWQGRIINEASGGWNDVAVKLAVQESETTFPAISGTIVYFQTNPPGGKKTLTDRQFPISGTWVRDSNQIKLDWSEEGSSYSFHCRLSGLLTDLLVCYGMRTVGDQIIAYRLKLHRALGWLGL